MKKTNLFLCSFVLFSSLAAKEKMPDMNFKAPQTFSVPNQRHIEFVNNIEQRTKLKDQSPADVTNPRKVGKEDSLPEKLSLSWKLPADAAKAYLVLGGGQEIRRYDVTGKESFRIDNLKVEEVYLCRLEVVLKSGKVLHNVIRFTTTNDLPRWIRIPGVSNVRDIGGWKTADGKYRVRQGLLYRGGEFDRHSHTTAEGREIFTRILGIKTDLDLRSVRGIEAGLSRHPISDKIDHLLFHYYSTDHTNPEPRKTALRLFHTLARSEIYPAYLHCAGGADRTGAAVFLLLGLLGLDDETMFTEFELTSFSRYGRRTRNGKTFSFLRRKLDTYGDASTPQRIKAERYLKDLGLSQMDIDLIRNIFLEKIAQ